jgi:hypothetical protein
MRSTLRLDNGLSFLLQAAVPQLVTDRETTLIFVSGPSDRTAIAGAASGTPYGHFACIRCLSAARAARLSRKIRPMKASMRGRQPGHHTTPAFKRERAPRLPTPARLRWTSSERPHEHAHRSRNHEMSGARACPCCGDSHRARRYGIGAALAVISPKKSRRRWSRPHFCGSERLTFGADTDAQTGRNACG